MKGSVSPLMRKERGKFDATKTNEEREEKRTRANRENVLIVRIIQKHIQAEAESTSGDFKIKARPN